ncbi:hypothetical protein EFR01_18580 [Sinorhizobium fredii]|nr:hypothetical protein EFR01_18580 [Sinorhizobium fredii]GLS09010.1 hypothetical protein GCM10007864_26400 [Sinorhizobium fredii]
MKHDPHRIVSETARHRGARHLDLIALEEEVPVKSLHAHDPYQSVGVDLSEMISNRLTVIDHCRVTSLRKRNIRNEATGPLRTPIFLAQKFRCVWSSTTIPIELTSATREGS